MLLFLTETLIEKMIRLISLTYLLLLFSCTHDSLGEPIKGDCENLNVTYVAMIKPIIDETCAYSTCHLDTAPGNFLSFNGLLPYLENGEFKNRVLNIKDDPTLGMPPDYVPNNRPFSLTDEELNLIRCWLDNNFPED